MGCIIKRQFGQKTYYYYSQSLRVQDHVSPGKTRVKTEQIYLGSAEDVRKRFQESTKPEIVRTRSFGIEAVALRLAQEIDLVNIIDRHVAKRHQGLSVGQYLLIAAINRLVQPTSKNGIAGWCETSALPDLMHIDSRLLKCQNFWDAFEKMVAQKAPLKKTKKSAPNPLVLDDSLLLDIERDLLKNISASYQVPLDTVIYDSTNYFTHFDSLNPSELARFAHSKDGKTNKRCIGLALGQTMTGDLPLFHLIYSANCHDAKLFPTALSRLAQCLSQMGRMTRGTVLVMDKGNNSQANIQEAAKKHGFTVVGSLVPSHFPDLVGKQLGCFTEHAKGLPAYREDLIVFGLPVVVVMTFNENLRKRQGERLEKRLQIGEERLREVIAKHGKKKSKKELQALLDQVRRSSGVGKILRAEVGGRKNKTFLIERRKGELKLRRQMLGKTILFSTDRQMPTEIIVCRYRQRDRVEKTFRLTKGASGIPFRPIHHWTDSKIRVFIFTCVLALLLWRLIMLKLRREGFPITDGLLRMELAGIREVVLQYSATEIDHRLSECSDVQSNILSILGVSASPFNK